MVTAQRVKEAIMSFEPYKAPDMDNITPVLMQQSLEEIAGLLTGVLRGCIALGYTPRQWLKTKVIFIPKPGKKSYTEELLLKTLERLVDGYLKEGPLKIWPLHE